MAESFSGKVFFANGAPAKGVQVRVFDKDEAGKRDDDLTVSPGVSDDEGGFTVSYELSRYLDYTEIKTRLPRHPPTDWRLTWRTYRIPDVTDVLLPYLEFRYTHMQQPRRHTELMASFVTEFRLPESLAPAEEFRPSKHGFKFTNSFSGYPLPFSVPELPDLPLVPRSYGLCGGMSSAACDFYLAGRSIPEDTRAPAKTSPLYQYLYRRQTDTFGALGQYIARFAAWTALPDGTIFGTRRRTHDEFEQVRARLDDKVPVALGLVYVRLGDTAELWNNHQVLAYDYSEAGSKIHINIYDPNYRKRDNIVIVAEMVRVGSRLIPRIPPGRATVHGLKCTQRIPGRASKIVRGFFTMPYVPIVPPAGLSKFQ